MSSRTTCAVPSASVRVVNFTSDKSVGNYSRVLRMSRNTADCEQSNGLGGALKVPCQCTNDAPPTVFLVAIVVAAAQGETAVGVCRFHRVAALATLALVPFRVKVIYAVSALGVGGNVAVGKNLHSSGVLRAHNDVCLVLLTVGKAYLEVCALQTAYEGVAVLVLVALYPRAVVTVEVLEYNRVNPSAARTVSKRYAVDVVGYPVAATRVSYGIVGKPVSYGIRNKTVSYVIRTKTVSYGVVTEILSYVIVGK